MGDIILNDRHQRVVEFEDKYILKIFEIALKTILTIYDALYIALAVKKKLPLVALDEKQAGAAQAS